MVKTIVSLCGVFCSTWAEIFEPSPRCAKTFATSKPPLASPRSFICASKSSSEIRPLRYALSSCCTSKSLVAIGEFLLTSDISDLPTPYSCRERKVKTLAEVPKYGYHPSPTAVPLSKNISLAEEGRKGVKRN